VAWLIHQHRAAYELAGTPFSDFSHTDADVALRERLIRLDTEMLSECRRVFANSRNTAARDTRFNGIAVTLYHPPWPAVRRGRPDRMVGRTPEAVKRADPPFARCSARRPLFLSRGGCRHRTSQLEALVECSVCRPRAIAR
jgi:hypothetical protein